MSDLLSQIAAEYSTPCFVYNFDQVRQRIAAMRDAFGGRFKISYAVKSNPNPAILQRMRGLVDLLDISSAGELKRAIDAGWAADLLSFTGPGKRDFELASAAEHRIGAVILESVQEAKRLDAVAGATGGLSARASSEIATLADKLPVAPSAQSKQSVLIRIAPTKIPPGFGVSMAGKPCQFGIDEEDLSPAIDAICALPNLDLVGFHTFAGTQCLKAETIAAADETYIDLFRRFCTKHGLAPRKLIFGSGLGIPYHDNDRPLDLSALAGRVNPAIDALRREERFAHTDFILETGRYLVGEAGLYLTRIVSRKRSRGAEIAICDGGMNHHLGACGHLGTLIHRNYRMFKLPSSTNTPEARPFDLYGPLCTSIDMLAHSLSFPGLGIGDIIAIHCSGAYGVTASPIHFISHSPPREILVETIDGSARISDVSQYR